MTNSRNFAINLALLLAIALIWGSQFAMIDIALESMSSLMVAASRTLIGAITLGFLSLFIKADQRSNKFWKLYLIIGLFEAVLPACLLTWGITRVESSIAAVIIASLPFFTFIFAVAFFKTDKLKITSVLGVIIGFVGLAILIYPEFKGNWFKDIGGELAILLASMSFAISINLISKLPNIHPAIAMRNSLGLASILLLIAAAIFTDITEGPIENFLIPNFEWASVASVLALGVFCSGLVYLFFVNLIRRAGPTFASLSNYLMPLVGAAIGLSLMDETFHANDYAALGVILVALVIFQAGDVLIAEPKKS